MLDKIKKLLSKKTTTVIEEPKIVCKKDIDEDRINLLSNEPINIKNKQDKIQRDDLYRLHYIYIERITDYEGYESYEIRNWVYPVFKIPNNIPEEEAYTFISCIYKLSQISQKFCIWDSVTETNRLLEKTNFEFQPNNIIETNIPKELYVIEGNIDEFKNTKYYNNYIDWYKEQVTKETLLSLYQKFGIFLNDLNIDIMFNNTTYISKSKEQIPVRKHTRKNNKHYQKKYS